MSTPEEAEMFYGMRERALRAEARLEQFQTFGIDHVWRERALAAEKELVALRAGQGSFPERDKAEAGGLTAIPQSANSETEPSRSLKAESGASSGDGSQDRIDQRPVLSAGTVEVLSAMVAELALMNAHLAKISRALEQANQFTAQAGR